MKCPYCGGVLSYQDVVCPYCGRENREGVEFQREVADKIEQNALLRIFLRNKKKPELIRIVLTRMVFIVALLNVAIIAFTICVCVWAKEGLARKPKADGFSGIYVKEFSDMDDYQYGNFHERAEEVMQYIDGDVIHYTADRYTLYLMVDSGYASLYESTGKERDARYAFQKAYYMGYFGLTEEQIEFLKGDNGEYEFSFPDTEDREKVIEAMLPKLPEVE